MLVDGVGGINQHPPGVRAPAQPHGERVQGRVLVQPGWGSRAEGLGFAETGHSHHVRFRECSLSVQGYQVFSLAAGTCLCRTEHGS